MIKLQRLLLICSLLLLLGCGDTTLNNPYANSEQNQSILYRSFSERPKHMDPAVSYSSNEYQLIAQIYEPPLQYHYLDRPYRLTPLTAAKMPETRYLDAKGKIINDSDNTTDIAFTEYIIDIQAGIRYQPHPALAKNQNTYRYHNLQANDLEKIAQLSDFPETGSRELVAEDYVYQIKRLVHPNIHSPIAEMMKQYIVGLDDFSKRVAKANWRHIFVNRLLAACKQWIVIVIKSGFRVNIRNSNFGWRCLFSHLWPGKPMSFITSQDWQKIISHWTGIR